MNCCFKGEFKVTSAYKLPERPDHNGIDLVGLDDKTVYAPCDGIIGASTIVTNKSNKTWEWGNYIRLDTSDGKYSIFMCHLASRAVTNGVTVKKGQKLGIMGNTGYSFGAHTHFEVRKKGTSTTVNPAEFIGIENKVGTYNAAEVAKNERHFVEEGLCSSRMLVIDNGDGRSTNVNGNGDVRNTNVNGQSDGRSRTPPLQSGNDIVWQLMNGVPKIEINEPERAIKALDKAKNHPEFMSLYWIIYKIVNGNG